MAQIKVTEEQFLDRMRASIEIARWLAIAYWDYDGPIPNLYSIAIGPNAHKISSFSDSELIERLYISDEACFAAIDTVIRLGDPDPYIWLIPAGPKDRTYDKTYALAALAPFKPLYSIPQTRPEPSKPWHPLD